MCNRILVVRRDRPETTGLAVRLRNHGFLVECVPANHVVSAIKSHRIDLIVVEYLANAPTQLDVCRAVRRAGFVTPLLVIAAASRVEEVMAALTIGADDYITHPVKTSELLTRVQVLLRRPKAKNRTPHVYRFGDVRFDVGTREATCNGVPVPLFAREHRLLQYFLEHAGVTFSREDLLATVWDRTGTWCTRTVDVHIANLRRKLESDPTVPKHFLTVHRVGYRFRR